MVYGISMGSTPAFGIGFAVWQSRSAGCGGAAPITPDGGSTCIRTGATGRVSLNILFGQDGPVPCGGAPGGGEGAQPNGNRRQPDPRRHARMGHGEGQTGCGAGYACRRTVECADAKPNAGIGYVGFVWPGVGVVAPTHSIPIGIECSGGSVNRFVYRAVIYVSNCTSVSVRATASAWSAPVVQALRDWHRCWPAR